MFAFFQEFTTCTGSFIASNKHIHDVKLNMGGYDATTGIDPSTKIQFFTLPGNTCPYAQRTAIVFNELEISFDLTEISGRPKPDWYLKINPRGKVPAIRVITVSPPQVIYESSICNEFLCDYATTVLAKDQQLLPSDPFSRAKIRLLNDHCDTVFTKSQFTFLMNKIEGKDQELANEMEDSLAIYEEALEESGGPFLCGEYFTLADVQIYPFILRLIVTLRHFKGYELSNDKFGRVLSWFHNCSMKQSVRQATISNEKIIEVYDMFMKADYKFGGLNQNK